MEDIYRVSREGFEKLHEKEKNLQDKLIKILSQKDDAFRNCGDMWHDNPTLNQLENEEWTTRKRIKAIRKEIERAKIIEDKKSGGDRIEIGSTVEIIFNGKEKMTLTILDPELTDPEAGIVSYESPLAKAILGAREGDLKNYKVNEREITVQIVKIID